jgi:hypothetical protein
MRKIAIILLVLIPITVGTGCNEAALRDAAMDGVSAFISDTISQSLSALFPVPQWFQPTAAE